MKTGAQQVRRTARVASRRERLDVRLVRDGLAESRQKAQALIMSGGVRVDGETAAKPGTPVRERARVDVVARTPRVGRGALKLEGALAAFGVDPADRVAVDVGASTGGFTEVLLERGARRVYAVDAGRSQLHERLRQDPRVVSRERTNARTLGPHVVPESCSLGVIDVSFISVLKILPALRNVLAGDADVLVLVKPQFEVGRRQVGRGGIVRDARLHADAVRGVAAGAREQGYAVRGACPSPITGSEGNREFFLHLRAGGAGLGPDQIEELSLRVALP
jgi:23S rRNA (cytidine1920-2'-O)/16S rRNA (cytidine1409-2'-O)-methyltransferase